MGRASGINLCGVIRESYPNTAVLFFTALLATPFSLHADWPQWRGATSNGLAPGSKPLLAHWKGGEFKQLWDSEDIPSNDDGGLSSVVVSGGRAYLSVVWHKVEPSETRQVSDLVVSRLDSRSTRLTVT